jgi:hypothetical protein
VLWQEFRDHSASLDNTLNEALRIHGGPAWRVFQVTYYEQGYNYQDHQYQPPAED